MGKLSEKIDKDEWFCSRCMYVARSAVGYNNVRSELELIYC